MFASAHPKWYVTLMKRSIEASPESPRWSRKVATSMALVALVLTGCEHKVAGTPVPISAIEEAAQTGSAIPLPEGIECPAGGQSVSKISGEIAIAQSFIAERYRENGQQRRLAANYVETHYTARGGMDVYCGDTNVKNGIDHRGKMIIPNSCVAAEDASEMGAIVIGLVPIPSQPWWDESTGVFVGCPKMV